MHTAAAWRIAARRIHYRLVVPSFLLRAQVSSSFRGAQGLVGALLGLIEVAEARLDVTLGLQKREAQVLDRRIL